jgi:transcriptional regulator with GAF, ATPase, and Fis domain
VEDLGSSHGTLVNGKKVKRADVSPGDEVRLGAVTVVIQPLLAKPLTAGPGKTHDAFLSALDDEVERARVFRRPMSVAMLSTDSHEPDVVAMLREIARPVDRFSLYGKGVYEVLFTELEAERALALLQPVAKKMRCTVGLASFPKDGTSPNALLAAALHSMRGKSGPPSQDRTPIAQSTLVAKSSAMKHLFEMAAKVAASPIPVLLRGETGAGKEVVARFIHEKSLRRGPYVAINCGAIPESLIEGTLFGHDKGAFTGAESDAVGVFEQAKEGTLLLDEVGELSAAAQVALLRVLESKEVRRVGGKSTLHLDVRVIAATHCDLEKMVKEGTFRQDLLYRLNAVALEVPPLRDRPEDLGPLIEQFLAEANASSQRPAVGLDRDAMQVLLRYAWPGNVRELRNVVERAVVVADEKVTASDLPDRIRNFELHALSAEGFSRYRKAFP